jgi:hypothetical protein
MQQQKKHCTRHGIVRTNEVLSYTWIVHAMWIIAWYVIVMSCGAEGFPRNFTRDGLKQQQCDDSRRQLCISRSLRHRFRVPTVYAPFCTDAEAKAKTRHGYCSTNERISHCSATYTCKTSLWLILSSQTPIELRYSFIHSFIHSRDRI